LTDSITIRDAIAADIPRVISLEKESASAAHWTEADYTRVGAAEDRGSHLTMQIALVAESQDAENGVVGFLIARAVGRDWEIENIVVANGHQRQGIGSKLLRRFIERARAESAENLLLEVRESNQAAIALYSANGFQEHGRRKSYYSNPEEDALLMRLVV
jgi:ribosomal-protein-alanine N-acetyltransferase